MKRKRYHMVSILFRRVRGAFKVSVASPRDVVRFGGAGRLDMPPIGFIRKVRSTRLRAVLQAL
jgi:hypothetical protein